MFLSLDLVCFQVDLYEHMHVVRLSTILNEAPTGDQAWILSIGGKGVEVGFKPIQPSLYENVFRKVVNNHTFSLRLPQPLVVSYFYHM